MYSNLPFAPKSLTLRKVVYPEGPKGEMPWCLMDSIQNAGPSRATMFALEEPRLTRSEPYLLFPCRACIPPPAASATGIAFAGDTDPSRRVSGRREEICIATLSLFSSGLLLSAVVCTMIQTGRPGSYLYVLESCIFCFLKRVLQVLRRCSPR